MREAERPERGAAVVIGRERTVRAGAAVFARAGADVGRAVGLAVGRGVAVRVTAAGAAVEKTMEEEGAEAERVRGA